MRGCELATLCEGTFYLQQVEHSTQIYSWACGTDTMLFAVPTDKATHGMLMQEFHINVGRKMMGSLMSFNEHKRQEDTLSEHKR